ncbi:unnamed protein product [Calypogeia fissa]
MASAGEGEARKPLFSFGIVADIQYGDLDTAGPDRKGHIKRYREAPGKLEKAVEAFNSRKNEILYVLTLGDIVEGNATLELTYKDLQEVLVRLEKLKLPVYHLLGNHCLNVTREIIMKELGLTARYYRKDIYPGWALVVLDSMDLSVVWHSDAEQYKEAMAFLEEHPLVTDESNQMVEWNGGIGSKQKAWLAGVLQEAQRDGTRLIVASHIPILKGSAPDTHLMWNFEEVASMLLGCPAVVLYICGHYHKGGYARQGNQHFVTVQSIVEAPTGSEAHGFVHVNDDKITIEGHGYVDSRVLEINGPEIPQVA